MSESHCPLCYSELESRQVTPCMECGGDSFEMDHYEEHMYKKYELYFGMRLVLCDFCDVDFGSYDPTFFGFPANKRVGWEDFKFIKDIHDKSLARDKYCPHCKLRLPFLQFVTKCRVQNEGDENTIHNSG